MKLENSVKMDVDHCPSCGGLLDGASGVIDVPSGWTASLVASIPPRILSRDLRA